MRTTRPARLNLFDLITLAILSFPYNNTISDNVIAKVRRTDLFWVYFQGFHVSFRRQFDVFENGILSNIGRFQTVLH
jgi:hypothetical protein